MSNLTQSALAVATLRALSKHVDAREADAKDTLLEDMADTGSASVNATLPNGVRVATISFVAPAPHATVVNNVALMQWLEANDPDALESVVIPAHTETHVRPEFLAALTTVGLHCYTPDGEEVPGVGASVTKPYLAVKSLKVEAIVDAFTSGMLDAAELLALPAPQPALKEA